MSSRLPFIIASVVVAAFAVLAAGCGGGSPAGAGVASSTTASTTTAQSGALAFARCMRSHGLSNWPDPNSSGVFDKSKLLQLGYSESRVRAVEQGACNHLLPQNGGGPDQSAAQRQAHYASLLAFARCLRSHGFLNVPDPTSSGQLTPEMLAQAGINLHQPALLQAADACVGVTHGVLTKANVARALNQSGAAGQ
jgi:hypothetical protein